MPEYLVTVREDDEGLFIRLPTDVAAELDARPDERLSLTPVDGGFLLSFGRPDPEESRSEHELAMASARKVMKRYADTLRRLADS